MGKNSCLKRALLLLVCIISINASAQVNLGGDAKYKLNFIMNQTRGFSACDGEGGINIVQLQGSTNVNIYHQDDSGKYNGGGTLPLEHTFTRNETFNNIWMNAESTRSGTFGCRSTNFHDQVVAFSGVCIRKTGLLTFQHGNDFNYILEVFPEVSIEEPPANAFLADDNYITITLPDDLDTNYYNWEYSIGTGAFRPFNDVTNGRPTNKVSILRIKGKEFLSTDDLGKKINIRVNPGCNVGQPSNTIDLEYLRTAPLIESVTPSPSTVSCYNKNDGSITIKFDRALDSDRDKINISITDMSNQIGTTSLGQPLYAPMKQFNGVSVLASDNSILLEGLPPSKAGFQSQIELFTTGYYTGDARHTGRITIVRPTIVEFDIVNKVDIWCFGGEDGEIHLEASGGTDSDYEYTYREVGSGDADEWFPFETNTTHKIKNLKPAEYEVKIRDRNGCVARVQNFNPILGEIELEEELILTTTINPIEKELSVVIEELNTPRAFGFKDGRIQATISGGTKNPADRSYVFEWVDQNNNPVLTTNGTEIGDDYIVVLHSIGEGTYTITVKDFNYDNATDKEGCTMIRESEKLEQPDPLKVTIDIQNPISCNIANEYSNGRDFILPFEQPDQFHDGALIATVTGGVPFDKLGNIAGQCRTSLRRYCYSWKKEINGIWVDVEYPDGGVVNDSIIQFQSVGNYALNIIDFEGIELGTYEEYLLADGSRGYRLDVPMDSLKLFPQPQKLGLSFKSTPVTCTSGNNGTASVKVSGGIGPYTYEWSNGKTSEDITELFAGKYTVTVEDSKGCIVKGSVTVEQPNGLVIETAVIRNPTCFEGKDGSLGVRIIGGVKPYELKWNTGGASDTINNLSSGTYVIEVTDANGCKAFYEDTLTDPDPVIVDMPEKRSLCNEQSLTLDISISDPDATYTWESDNGFTSSDSTVEITDAGKYTATITSSLGCIGIGSIDVAVFDRPIDADFLITTQAYAEEEVILVNVSEPIGELVEWTVPDGVELISKEDDKLVLKFDKEGPYDILLTSHQGDCFEEYTKTIIVQPAIAAPEVSASGGFIEEFIVFPNPNKGEFKTKITLAEDSNITVKIVNLMTGMTVHERSENNQRDFLLEYAISMPTGVYLMLLETPKGSETRKLIFE